METLALHIEYLLTRHDCVIVPGFGAFIATERDSFIDLERGIIRPRRREISFNSNVVTDDGLLTHSIARREHLSYEEARCRVAAMTEKAVSDLREEGEVSLGMTGRLLMDEEGLISFRPRRSKIQSDILPDIRMRRSGNTAPTPMADAFQNESLKAEPAMRTITVPADRYVMVVSKRVVHAAAMIVMILAIGLSVLVPINHDNEQRASVVSLEELFPRKEEAAKASDTDTISHTSVRIPEVEL